MSDVKLSAFKNIHLIGLGGIGMSALAQLLVTLGYKVTGSDRDLETPAQKKLFAQLAEQGIKVYLQDGSGVKESGAEVFVYSSAIEDDNPDFVAGPNLARLHRSKALKQALDQTGLKQIAVAGSCGKTSVTGWLTAALQNLGQNPMMVNGGYSHDFSSDQWPGNFKDGENFVVYEADESDGSLVNFSPDYSLLLNTGTDHYDYEDLKVMFSKFLGNAKQAMICNHALPEIIPISNTKTLTFSRDAGDLHLLSTNHENEGLYLSTNEDTEVRTQQWGDHSAENALAVLTVLKACGFSAEDSAKALFDFKGVLRRFDFKGHNDLLYVYDDYAHNPEKIAACLSAAQKISGRPVLALFQAHGYGPLGFMREALKQELTDVLRPQDNFVFLPVFYAGGTTSFKPSAEEVCRDYQETLKGVDHISDKGETADYLAGRVSEPKTIVVLGARDPGLPDWAKSLVEV